MKKICVLNSNKICVECNLCNICDLNPEKLCDNCGKCLEDNKDYIEIKIDGILDNEEEISDYIYDEAIENMDDEFEYDDEDAFNDSLYIEDIPELKEEYDKKINKILKREE